jgi:hypothetical protein
MYSTQDEPFDKESLRDHGEPTLVVLFGRAITTGTAQPVLVLLE